MKLNLEKIFFYFMLVIVSGSIGYAVKPVENIDQKVLEEKYVSQQKACTQAMYIMNNYTKKNYYQPKTKKEWAIERMMSN
jgi:hypothetical protein